MKTGILRSNPTRNLLQLYAFSTFYLLKLRLKYISSSILPRKSTPFGVLFLFDWGDGEIRTHLNATVRWTVA
jgi:hypothetical protein